MAVLDLHSSPPGTGKTTACIDAFKNKILESRGGIDSRSFFILPNREHAERIRNLVLKQDVPGLFNAHILTIHDFTSRLLASAGRTVLSDTLRKRVLKQIFEDSGFASFEKVKAFQGFYDLLVDTIKEFKSGLLSIPEFERRSQKLLKDPVFRAKFRDFSVMMKRYEKALEALNVEEPEDAIARLLADPAPPRAAALVIFDGFYHFTRAQRKFITYLTRVSDRLLVTLTLPENYEERPEVFDYPIGTRQFLLETGFKEKRAGVSMNHRTLEASLRHLEKNLFLETPQVFKGIPENIVVLEGRSLRGEVEMIAREIKKLYRSSELHYSDICVILRKIGAYKELILSVFAEFGLPVIVHEREKLIHRGFIAALWRVLNLIDEDWKREDLFYLLKSPVLKKGLSMQAQALIEKIAFQKNIVSGRERWLDACAAWPDVRAALQKLRAFESAALGSKNAEHFVKVLRSFVREANPEADPQDTEALEALDSLLESAARFYRGSARPFSGALFIRELKESLKTALFSAPPQGKNRVQVYDVVMALPKEYKAVFISGLLEKNFPLAAAEDPLFKDEERRVINARDAVLEERSRRVFGERFFFTMAVARAREKLYLTFPKYDAEGRPALASFFIEEVKKCFTAVPEIKKDIGDLVPDWREWETEREIFLGLSENLFQRSGRLPSAVLKTADEYAKEKPFQGVLKHGFSDGHAVFRDKRILRILSEKKEPFSPTRLETFALCSFRYFAGETIHLNEPLEGRDNLEMGNILHRVLESFYNDLAKDPNGAALWKDRPAALKLLNGKLDQELLKSPFAHQPLYRQKIIESGLRRTLALFAARESRLFEQRSFTPRHFEFKFKELKVPHGEGEYRIRGQIDRIDIDPVTGQALVVDYKLSPRSDTLRKKLSKGLELQLPLYLLAVRRLLGLDVAGAELRFLTSATSEGVYLESARQALGLGAHAKTFGADEFEKMLEETERLVRDYAQRLRSGDIAVNSKSCKYCRYSAVCRFEPWKLVYSGHD